MKLLIFKTNIESVKSLHAVEHIFNEHPEIVKWFIDFEDIDKVLKIKGVKNLSESEVQSLLGDKGFNCEPLPD